MTAAFIADTGVFVRAGGQKNDKYRRLRRAVRGADAQLLLPRRVYEELGGDPATAKYPSGATRWNEAIEEGWTVVADDLEYVNPVVSASMDDARRIIANETDRPEDCIEKADTALIGLAVQVLATNEGTAVVLLSTDKPAGRASEIICGNRGYGDRFEFRYVDLDFLESVTPDYFCR